MCVFSARSLAQLDKEVALIQAAAYSSGTKANLSAQWNKYTNLLSDSPGLVKPRVGQVEPLSHLSYGTSGSEKLPSNLHLITEYIKPFTDTRF